MKKFPVKIDLSTFFQDERKFVIILVDPQWENVEHLQHRVEEIFDVRPVRFLTNDNLFIPPLESIEVVEFAESLKAFIPKHAIEESNRRSKTYNPEVKEKKACSSNVLHLPCTEEQTKKRKYHSSSTPNKSKKSRRTLIDFQNSLAPSVISAPNESQEITSTNDQNNTLKGCVLKCDDDKTNTSKKSLSQYTDILENECTKDEGGERDVLVKRKRKRLRSKQTTDKNASSMTIGPEIPSSTLLNNSKSADKNSHIFDDSTIIETKHSTTKKPKSAVTHEQKLSPKIIFKCKLYENNVERPLVIPLKVINKCNRSRKTLLDIKENILLPPADLKNIIKRNSKQEFNSELKDIQINNATAIENPVSAETESDICTKNGNATAVELKNSIDSISSETINNIENLNHDTNSESLKENNKNEMSTTETLEDSNVPETTNKKIGNDCKDTIEKKSYSESEKIINSENEMPKMPTDSNERSPSEKFDVNTIVDPSFDEYSVDKTQKETKNSKSKNNQDEISPEKNETEELESSSLLDESCVIDLDDDDEVIDLSDADDQPKTSAKNHSGKLSHTLNKSISSMSIEEMLPFCTKLNDTPKVGDVILFKFNRKIMGGKKDVSEFIACTCDHVNRRTKVLKLAILDASKEKNIIPHQYAYNLDESFVSDKFMNIKITDLIDPKVLEA